MQSTNSGVINPFVAALSNTLTTKEDINEPFYIVDIVPTVNRIVDNETNLEKMLHSWKFICATETGEPLVFMMSKNSQRNTMVETFMRLFKAGHSSPLFRLVQTKMKQQKGGNDWTWTLEVAE